MASAAIGAPTGVHDILYVTDFSRPSEAALPFAVAAARRYGAKIHALYVSFPVPGLGAPQTVATSIAAEEDPAQAQMHKLDAKLADVPHDTLVARGLAVWTVIQQAFQDSTTDLIVLGTDGRTSLAKVLMGSVAQEILRHSPVPVVSVGPGVRELRDGQALSQPRQVLFATDFTPDSNTAARYAINLAQEHHAKLTLLHILRQTRSKKKHGALSVAEAIHQLYEIIPKDPELWSTPDAWVEHGQPSCKIPEVAETGHAALIVLGGHDPVTRARAATPVSRKSVHQVVIAKACCPVVTVREPDNVVS